MREIAIDPSINSKILKGKKSFYIRELPVNFPSLSSGEWVSLIAPEHSWCAYGNPHVSKEAPMLWVVAAGIGTAEGILEKYIERSFKKRNSMYPNEGKRLVYGQSDELPGLVVDEYEEHILIQINTAGMDRYREKIHTLVSQSFPHKRIILFDRDSYRTGESLPVYKREWDESEQVDAIDSGFRYTLTLGKMQKLGFYYDHRDNRMKFENYVASQLKGEWSALDLFCYQGAWGMHAARAGAQKVDLVDQADLKSDVENNFKQLELNVDVNFKRDDVFKFLDKAIVEDKKWMAVVCDPPAFCKSLKQKNQALSGYQKLYAKSLQVVSSGGVLVVASCTKYVGLSELMKLVEDQAFQLGRKIWLKDIGVQGRDHPFNGFRDSACYIKYALYAVE